MDLALEAWHTMLRTHRVNKQKNLDNTYVLNPETNTKMAKIYTPNFAGLNRDLNPGPATVSPQ